MKAKKFIPFLCALLIFSFAFVSCGGDMTNGENSVIVLNGEEYTLTFYDGFDGEKLDRRKWELCPEQKRQDVGGYWDDSQTSLDGEGHLVLSADINDKGTPVSGAVRSRNKFEQARGYFEIRCKLQSASGFWGAFWLMCDEVKNVGNGASDGAEIDIFESHDVNGYINHAIHWDGYGDDHKTTGKWINTDCYDGEFHTFSLLWTESEYVFYIDGKETYRISEGDKDFPGSCEEKCYLKITTEFGSWAGKYDKNELPDSIIVDYVKVYEKSEKNY